MVLFFHSVSNSFGGVIIDGISAQFAIIPQNSKDSIIIPNMDSVSISDTIIQYIGDSLKWIHTIWNGKRLQNGISYYGFSFIESREIVKFKSIIKQWVELFCLSPDEFYLTGEFLPDEERYDNILVKRDELIKNLNACIDICNKAINEGAKILHNGI